MLDFDGIAAIIAAVASLLAAQKAKSASDTSRMVSAEMRPNHGSSLRDQINLIRDTLKSHGKQLGEIRDDSRQVHGFLQAQIDDLKQNQK